MVFQDLERVRKIKSHDIRQKVRQQGNANSSGETSDTGPSELSSILGRNPFEVLSGSIRIRERLNAIRDAGWNLGKFQAG